MVVIESHRILVIDDEPHILNFIEINLVHAGFRVLKAVTGQQGIDLAFEEGCSLVLTDLRLPDMDGVEVMQKIHERLPRLPTIIMTGYGTIDNAVEAMKRGARDYLTKPVTIQDVIFRIHKVLEFVDLEGEVQQIGRAHV